MLDVPTEEQGGTFREYLEIVKIMSYNKRCCFLKSFLKFRSFYWMRPFAFMSFYTYLLNRLSYWIQELKSFSSQHTFSLLDNCKKRFFWALETDMHSDVCLFFNTSTRMGPTLSNVFVVGQPPSEWITFLILLFTYHEPFCSPKGCVLFVSLEKINVSFFV